MEGFYFKGMAFGTNHQPRTDTRAASRFSPARSGSSSHDAARLVEGAQPMSPRRREKPPPSHFLGDAKGTQRHATGGVEGRMSSGSGSGNAKGDNNIMIK